MALRADDLDSWQKGREGEQEYAHALVKGGVYAAGNLILRNVKFGDRGDIDFVIIGPHGVAAIDVKNWSGVMGPSWQAKMDQLGQTLEAQQAWLEYFLGDALRKLGLPGVSMSLVMVGQEQPYDQLGDFPIHTPDQSIAALLSAPTVLEHADVVNLGMFARDVLGNVGAPAPR